MKKLFFLVLVIAFSVSLTSTVIAEESKGQGVYMNFCAACHDSGIAGAPKVGDKADWQDRMEKGSEAMATLAINGFQGKTGFMPAKGGHSALTDEEVTSATMYMIKQSK